MRQWNIEYLTAAERAFIEALGFTSIDWWFPDTNYDLIAVNWWKSDTNFQF